MIVSGVLAASVRLASLRINHASRGCCEIGCLQLRQFSISPVMLRRRSGIVKISLSVKIFRSNTLNRSCKGLSGRRPLWDLGATRRLSVGGISALGKTRINYALRGGHGRDDRTLDRCYHGILFKTLFCDAVV